MDEVTRFRPAWWLPGAHAQTIGSRLVRRRDGVTLRRERLELPDGDFVDLDWAEAVDGRGAGDRAPLVMVVHGLEGSARANYVLEMHRALSRYGLASVGLNLRSCSGEPNRLPRFYHSGETGDLALVLAELRRREPGRPLGAAGFSLGANALLKHLGECGGEGRDPGVEAAAGISIPFDLAAGGAKLERGSSRMYQTYLMRKLRRKVRLKEAMLRDHVDVPALLAARTFRQFDDLGTARLHGFEDADDYYSRSSSGPFLAAIRTPTMVIHSEDDPFMTVTAIPRDTVAANPALTGLITRAGGHVGFVGGRLRAPVFWGERTAAAFLAQALGQPAPAG